MAKSKTEETGNPVTGETTVAELAAMGGKARAESMTPERRKEIAARAAEARWGKKAAVKVAKKEKKKAMKSRKNT